jgi:hypothetical protein
MRACRRVRVGVSHACLRVRALLCVGAIDRSSLTEKFVCVCVCSVFLCLLAAVAAAGARALPRVVALAREVVIRYVLFHNGVLLCGACRCCACLLVRAKAKQSKQQLGPPVCSVVFFFFSTEGQAAKTRRTCTAAAAACCC